MLKIPQTSDRFTAEWLKYYVDENGRENVFLSQNQFGQMFIEVIEDEDRSTEV